MCPIDTRIFRLSDCKGAGIMKKAHLGKGDGRGGEGILPILHGAGESRGELLPVRPDRWNLHARAAPPAAANGADGPLPDRPRPGRRGFGITYIGCDLRLELRVAIKEYYPATLVSRRAEESLCVRPYAGMEGSFEKGRLRFLTEARAMAKMDKTPEIVSVRDFFEENNTAYIVMEYLDGTTFKELVRQGRPHRGRGAAAPDRTALWRAERHARKGPHPPRHQPG